MGTSQKLKGRVSLWGIADLYRVNGMLTLGESKRSSFGVLLILTVSMGTSQKSKGRVSLWSTADGALGMLHVLHVCMYVTVQG